MNIQAALIPYIYTKEVYTISVTALTNVPLKVISEGKKPIFLPPRAKSSTDLVEVILPSRIPISVKPRSTAHKSVELIIGSFIEV